MPWASGAVGLWAYGAVAPWDYGDDSTFGGGGQVFAEREEFPSPCGYFSKIYSQKICGGFIEWETSTGENPKITAQTIAKRKEKGCPFVIVCTKSCDCGGIVLYYTEV